jgi:hypothetical protein
MAEKHHWDSLLSEAFRFPLSVSSRQLIVLTHHRHSTNSANDSPVEKQTLKNVTGTQHFLCHRKQLKAIINPSWEAHNRSEGRKIH